MQAAIANSYYQLIANKFKSREGGGWSFSGLLANLHIRIAASG
jgi:hypothetical protein